MIVITIFAMFCQFFSYVSLYLSVSVMDYVIIAQIFMFGYKLK